jgi:integrase
VLKVGPSYARDLDLVFAGEVGQPLNRRNLVQRHFKPVLEDAELPRELRLYDLRHTCCSLALQAGIPVRVVAERLGHASAAMTLDVYGHVLPGDQERATAKLGEVLFGD